MPFDNTARAVYGNDARKIRTWVRDTFCAWLAGKLNDPEGPYFEPLHLTAGAEATEDSAAIPERLALVSGDAETVGATYSLPKAPPVVFVNIGPLEERPSGRNIDGVFYPGQRYSVTLSLDMSVQEQTPDDDTDDDEPDGQDNYTGVERDSALVADFVFDAIRRGREELDALGICNAEITSDDERQQSGDGVHPHEVTGFVVALDDWAPA